MEKLNLIENELALAGTDQRVRERLMLLEERRITPDRVLPQMDFLFTLFGHPCFPRGELVALTGKAKSGKTLVSSILMALAFQNRVLSFQRTGQERLHVLWYDTEQSEESTKDILLNRIIPLAGMTPDSLPLNQLDVFNVRGVSHTERLPLLELAIGRCHPDLAILDGIRDLVADINDGVVAQDTVERLMRTASDGHCCIVCVLHQNKSLDDPNLRGWIGTELTNKAFEVYVCEKNGQRVFSLYQTHTRKYDIVDRLHFTVGADNLPREAGPVASAMPQPAVQSDAMDVFREVLAGKSCMRYNELSDAAMKRLHIRSYQAFYRLLKRAIEKGIVEKSRDLNGHVIYSRSDVANTTWPSLYAGAPPG